MKFINFKYITIASLILLVSCDNPLGDKDNDDNPSFSVVGEWERTYLNTQLEIKFHSNGSFNGVEISSANSIFIPDHIYTIDNNTITFSGSCLPYNSSEPNDVNGKYSYSIDETNTLLTISIINDECPTNDREAFLSYPYPFSQSSAIWRRVE